MNGGTLDRTPAGSWYAAFDALRIASPKTAATLASEFPHFKDEIVGRRVMGLSAADGNARVQRANLGRAAVEEVLAAVTTSLDEVLSVVRERAAFLARMRLASAIVTLIGTSGTIAATIATIPFKVEATAVSAAVAFISSAITLVSAYREDASGGEGSISHIREEMIGQIGDLATARGKLALSRLQQRDDDLFSIMTALNSIAEKVLVARRRSAAAS